MNPEDLPDYIQPFTHLFNKKKFEKLLKRHEWDHKINLIDKAPKELKASYVDPGPWPPLSSWRLIGSKLDTRFFSAFFGF